MRSRDNSLHRVAALRGVLLRRKPDSTYSKAAHTLRIVRLPLSLFPSRLKFAAIGPLAAVVLAPILLAPTTSAMSDREPAKVTSASVHRPEPTYKITVGLDGDVFPVFANYASMQAPQQREWGTVAVTITNSTDASVRDRIAVKIAGWSDQEIQIAEMAAGQVRTFKFAPTFLPRLYQNHEISAATAMVEISDMGGRSIYQTTMPVRLRSVDDMYWGTKFKYAPFIASWVTPHESQVEQILSLAKESAPNRRLPGYESWKDAAMQERATQVQAKVIYDAVKQHGVSYVKSSVTFGGSADVSQRIRMPRESLMQNSANCIDGAVTFASLFENLGMDPIVMLVPGHAFVGVRVAQGSQRYLFIDVAQVARMNFESAVRSAEVTLGKFQDSEITRIPIDQAREAGIYPMPF